MKRLYLVRHGETAWNLEGRTQGRRDSHLTERGLYQATMLAKRLTKEPIDIIYSSNLDRAKSTAAIIGNELGLESHFHEGLAELSFGLWEGLTIKEIERDYPDAVNVWHSTPQLPCIPDGELLAVAQARINAAIEEILQASADKNILIVSHGTVLKLYLQGFLGMDLKDFYRLKQENCALNIIEYKKRGPMLTKYNDTSYMDIMIEGEALEKP